MNSEAFCQKYFAILNGKRYLPVPLAQLFTLILFFYWLNLCAVSLADQ